MTKFSQLAPAASISAQQLDENFREVAPSDNQDIRHVQFLKTADGWKLTVYPEFPGQTSMLASDGSQPYWMTVGELLQLLTNEGLDTDDSPMLNPPSGTPAWQQVERCDGKRMYVWGTDWT